ncbi:(2Fe-2S)-binding protein [Microbacterium sp. ARD32]|uniref:(2Fe-2S)-binding protein n=1 Tax=Microbacterium sp. ARD32 TaxID=2962577 RepID=UPI002880CA7E|nr:(2Fe-2S)-binding protein [Microbacterium sp. ARD32]MDT0158824.1 (2Fe-2S)-binding protein [Microbacterium sp. ARD32]
MSSIRISFGGEVLDGREGQSIAGILLAHGQRTWRTAAGAERGIFCGIGICQDCVVTVNGTEGVRACQRTACEGDVVEREARP